MEELLANKPEVMPVSTCESSSSSSSSSPPVPPPVENTPSSSRKRKPSPSPNDLLQRHLEASAKRHEDRMDRYDRFLNLMEQLVKRRENQ